MAKVIIIAAVAENGVIGAGERIPWSLPEDLKHFRQVTTGHAILMGGKTFRSIGRPLPNRHNVVVSRTLASADGYTVHDSYVTALAAARAWADANGKDVYVIGGGEIYRQAMGDADELLISHVHGEYAGDVIFPNYEGWHETSADDRGGFVIKVWHRLQVRGSGE